MATPVGAEPSTADSLLLLPGQAGYDEVAEPRKRDLAEARSLLEKAGYEVSGGEAPKATKDGDQLTLTLPVVGGSPSIAARAKSIAAQLAEVGIAVEVRTRWVEAPQEAVYRAFASLGGGRGWRVWRWAWRIRGLIDQLLGGPGLRRGRRHPVDLQPGEAVDFWRVEDARPPELLLLRAEMKVPGKAWLQWEAVPEGNGTRLIQRAFFSPTGFWGAAYW